MGQSDEETQVYEEDYLFDEEPREGKLFPFVTGIDVAPPEIPADKTLTALFLNLTGIMSFKQVEYK